MSEKYEYLIVGSGAGGATLARELSKKGKEVLVIELGENKFPLPFVIEKSIEGTDIFTAYGAGGATVLMNANGVRCLEKELAQFGLVLDNEFKEIEEELKLAPIHESLLSENGSIRLLQICKDAGIRMERMPKFIDHEKCIRCGNCSLGCPTGAKWTAVEYLRDAEALGTKVIYNTKVEKVIVENGRAKGIEAIGPDVRVNYYGDMVVLAAGGIKTPVILQKSGIENAGKSLFIDTCECWYGVTPDIDISNEPPMQLVNTEFLESQGFIHSIGASKNKEKLRYYLREKADDFMKSNYISVIVKIRDEGVGRIYPDGSFSKGITPRDRMRLDKGGEGARNFLMTAGAKADTIVKREGLYGGHIGAASAIGTVVDKNLQTKIDNLFVCDASVLPESPGLPPVLTIMAIARWFAKTL
jgi:choline dehydrogenase-like flavoprotein